MYYYHDRKKLLQFIHVAKKNLRLGEDEYRAILFSASKKESCQHCTVGELNEVLQSLKKIGFRVRRLPVTEDDRGSATENQLVYIKGLWELVAREKTEDSLHSFIKRIVHVSHIRFLTPSTARQVILALRQMCVNAGINPDKKDG